MNDTVVMVVFYCLMVAAAIGGIACALIVKRMERDVDSDTEIKGDAKTAIFRDRRRDEKRRGGEDENKNRGAQGNL